MPAMGSASAGQLSSAADENVGILRARALQSSAMRSPSDAAIHIQLASLCLSSAAAKSPCEFPVEVIQGFLRIVVGSLRAKCQVACAIIVESSLGGK